MRKLETEIPKRMLLPNLSDIQIEGGERPLFWLFSKHQNEQWDYYSANCSQVLFLMEGNLEMVTQSQETISLMKNQFVFLPPQRKLIMTARASAVFLLLDFRRKSLSCGNMKLGEDIHHTQEHCEYPLLDAPPVMIRALNTMCGTGVNDIIKSYEYQSAKESELWAIFWQCFSPYKVAWFLQSAIAPQDEFRLFIESHFTCQKNVSQIITETGIGRDTFRQQFLKTFKVLPSEWLAQQRINKMKELVRNGEYNIKHIMAAIGMTQRSTFNKFCLEKIGCPPVEAIAKMKREGKG